MNIKIGETIFEDSKEVVIIYWEFIDNLKVFAKKDNIEIDYPYTHRTAYSYIESLEVILEEYPDYISYVDASISIKIDKFQIEKKNYLVFIDNGLTKLYFSSISYSLLNELLNDIKRIVSKGIRVDVN